MIHMKRQICLFAVVSFFLLFPLTSALDAVPGWQATCVDETTLLKIADVRFNNTLYNFNQTVDCQYGCDEGRDICHKWPSDALPGEYFLTLEIFVLGLFLLIIFRLDENEEDIKIFDIILPMFCFILFVLLALQGNNVIDMSTGEAVRLVLVVYLDYGLGTLCLVPFFFNIFKFVKQGVER